MSWNLVLGKFLLLNFFFWKSGLNLHWISMTSLSKHVEVLQSNGNVGPQTQFCKNSELVGSFRKVEGWPSSRPQAVHSFFSQSVQARYTMALAWVKGLEPRHCWYLYSGTVSLSRWVMLMTQDTPKHCGFGCPPSLSAPKWYSLQSHSNGLDFRLCQEWERKA